MENPNEKLWNAIMNNDKVKAKEALKEGANPNDEKALFNAIYEGTDKIVKMLLDRGADPNTKDKRGQTILSWAINRSYKDERRKDFIKIIKMLLKKGVDIEIKNPVTVYKQRTPIIEACWNRDKEIVKLLLAYGANLDAKDSEGKTALDYAKESKNKKIIKLLEKT